MGGVARATLSGARAWLPFAVAVTSGLAAGWWVGATARDEASRGSPEWWFPPAERLWAAALLGVLVLLLVAGLVAIRPAWRHGAGVVLIGAMALGMGTLAGTLLGSDHRIWREVPGTVDLRLDPPVALALAGPARCLMSIDDAAVVRIETLEPFAVAGQPVGAVLDVDPRDRTGSPDGAIRPSVTLTVDGRVAYQGRLGTIVSRRGTSGSATFALGFVSDLPELRLGGAGGPQRLSGRASWTCGARDPTATGAP